MEANNRLNGSSYKIYLAVLLISSLALVSLICWFLRDTVLGCHDSMAEFTYSRMWSLEFAYEHARTFNLQRGRVGFLFPLIVAFRYWVNGTGNFAAVWLLQQVPIWINVFLISFIVGKKTKPYYGIYFAAFFCAFVQIDIDHNLMTCYPLDFMYGLTLTIAGLYLYDGWLAHLGKKKKTNWIRLIFSCLCYYEAMQVYEAFLMACFCYAVISIAYAFKLRKEYGKKWFGMFLLHLIPHGITGALYVGIVAYVRTHPIVEGTLSSGEPGALGFFLPTWFTFSVSLLPLRHRAEIDKPAVLASIFTDPFTGLCTLVMVIATVMLFMCILKRFPQASKEEQKNTNYTLGALGLTGLAWAMSFNIPLGIDSKYQQWVCGAGAKGYMTGVICYFGWTLFFICAGSLIANFLSNRKNYIHIPAYVIAALCLACGTAFTAGINELYLNAEAAAGNCLSKKGLAFYAFVTSDDIEALNADYIYVPDYGGIHGFLNINNDYANFELGRPVTLCNNADEFRANAANFPVTAEFRYNGVMVAGYYFLPDNPADPEEDWITTSDIVIVTAKPGPIVVTYYDSTAGETVTVNLEGGRFGSFLIQNSNEVDPDTITIDYAEG
ncbi:MAG: hypothetical protein K6F45_06335 [Saccharofermentans sp.]|nr:hypothetical protein [Saccharofermentans sp.]